MRLNRIVKSAHVFSVHTSLFCFTILLLLKLDHIISYSWWVIFSPLFVFHAVVSRGRFYIAGSFVSHQPHVLLLVAFEVILCVFLESAYAKEAPIVSLKIVFLLVLPLLAFELTILIDNLSMWPEYLLSESYEDLSDDEIRERLSHLCVAISIGFFVAGTIFTLQKLSGDTSSLTWLRVFICFGIAECFAFLVWTVWSDAVIHRYTLIKKIVRSTRGISEHRTHGLGGHVMNEHRTHGLGGHLMKISVVVFQILLCMHLEGNQAVARFISLPVVFSPISIAQGLRVFFAASNLIKKIFVILPSEVRTGIYFTNAARACDSFLQHRVRSFVWPFVKQKDITISTQQNYETLQNDKIMCKICFDREINTVLLPCRHNILCRFCSEKCEICPICRVFVKKRLHVFGV